MKNPFLNKLFLFLPKSLGRKTFSQDSRSAYKSMRICTSKMLVGIAIVFCSWGLPQFVFAQTQYFTFTSMLAPQLPTPGSPASGLFSGVFSGEIVGGTGNLLSLVATYDGKEVTSIPLHDTGIYGHYHFTSGGSPVLDYLTFTFNTMPTALSGGPYLINEVNANTIDTRAQGAPNYGVGGTSTLSFTNGAPEIDGSLAPKVGFLLGCLFLMFGRKRQNTEPMMTA